MSDIKENSLEQTSSPSPEEEDLIRRSTKKQKGDGSFLPPWILRSYKDSLVNPEGYWQDHTMQETMHTEETNEVTSDVEDNIDEDIPIAPASPISPKTPEHTHPPSFEQDSSNFGKWMIVSRRKSVAKKAIQKNTNTIPKSPVTSNASKHRNSKPINSTPRDPPLEPHKASMSSSPIPIGKDKGDPTKSGRKSDQLGSSKQPSSSLNTQTVNYHSVNIDSTHLGKSNTTLLSSTENNTLNTRFIPSHVSVNCHHVSQTSDHTSNHPLKVNPHLPTDQVPNSPLITTSTNSNPLTSMDIDASKLTPSSEPHSNSHIPNTPCPTTHSAHGSTSSVLSPESPKHTKQTSLPQQKPQQKPECPQSTQTPSPSTNTHTITHTSTLSTTHTNNTISGELGSTQEGYTASHWRSPSEMASGLPDPILDTSGGRNGTSFKSSNPSNSCEYTVRPGSNQPNFRTSDCISHNYAHIQRFPSMERTPSSDPWTSTDQENSEWHGDNIRATRCRSPRSHDHSHILGEHPNSHSLLDDRQHHHPSGNSSKTPVIQIVSRSPPIRNASRTLLPSGDEPKCTNNFYPQSASPKQNPHQEERVFRGAGNPNFRRNFADLLRSHRPSIDVLVETRISGQRAEDISSMLGFNHTWDLMGHVSRGQIKETGDSLWNA
ncbi:putative ribonuclease h protein [Fagus crenata]